MISLRFLNVLSTTRLNKASFSTVTQPMVLFFTAHRCGTIPRLETCVFCTVTRIAKRQSGSLRSVLGQFGVKLGSVWGHLGSIRRASRAIREHQGGILRPCEASLGAVFAFFDKNRNLDVRKTKMRTIPGPEHRISLGKHVFHC